MRNIFDISMPSLLIKTFKIKQFPFNKKNKANKGSYALYKMREFLLTWMFEILKVYLSVYFHWPKMFHKTHNPIPQELIDILLDQQTPKPQKYK